MNLTTQDYKTILNYYNISHKSKTNTWIKRNAEDILANKLCRCIKKVKKQSKLKEPASIAICKKSIFKKRNLKSGRFSCKKKRKLYKLKGQPHKLKKTKRVIFRYY
tara:strand:- start:3294 stop:3611 length:318 start_codon:yes stop_codon:yes gene_type:complete